MLEQQGPKMWNKTQMRDNQKVRLRSKVKG